MSLDGYARSLLQLKCMKSSLDYKSSFAAEWDFDLDLPGGAGFASQTLPVDPALIIELSEERLPLLNARPDAEQKRWLAKSLIPFEL